KALPKKEVKKKIAVKKSIKSAAAKKKQEEEEVLPIPIRPKLRKSLKLSNFEAKQQQKLRDLRDSLLDTMAGVARDNLRSDSDGGDSSAFGMHQADAGSDAYDRDFALNLLSQEQDALHEIEEALKRIDYGTYGICEMSKKKIINARLEAIPFARFTVECQAQIEKESGIRGGRRLPDRSNMVGYMEDTSGVEKA
ncbi:TraR/DksA C4-type zinc finger protein, partial [Verrucomicrobiales bacterium]|nr:TraR/DksA C4-type zinc finger protein [Verrucomicrobiales bacterium]